MARPPGYQLHRILRKWFGQKFSATCHCKAMIRKMNEWGPAGCREHLEEIIATMRGEAKRRGFFMRIVSEFPGVSRPMRELVLLAISRSEDGG